MTSFPRSAPSRLTAGAALVGAAGVALLAAAVAETRKFEVRTEVLPLLPPGAERIRILQLSDIHFVPGQDGKAAWLEALGEHRPDLILNTGDNLSHPGAVPPLLRTLGELPRTGGFYVPGSNDYYEPKPKNPAAYLVGPSKNAPARPELPWRELFAGFESFGWQPLTNARACVEVKGTRLEFSGVDDPHLDRHEVQGFGDDDAAVRIGVTHAPYVAVLNEMTEAGADLLVAGHTHGGQVCLPGGRALVSNCDLPPAQARGLSTWTAGGRSVPLTVSAGLGQSRYAPVRVFCRPEAVILDLVARA
ncbi:metallophosphoesterase [Falsarthrobacter nasiphocae]|uniref:MPP superfamily phosphohydrolase n=1 Tax=Falsarthrobacter nasiphocae TaxID=189863 RepID=A0AAE3YHM2_9MICC|nr:metallophosphoesterase [Falsarthrobacter nasiphocae]MDR6892339.1 putative MPP superfamily phosphohydrolase [Falsarthrobacter nasiphocae]